MPQENANEQHRIHLVEEARLVEAPHPSILPWHLAADESQVTRHYSKGFQSQEIL